MFLTLWEIVGVFLAGGFSALALLIVLYTLARKFAMNAFFALLLGQIQKGLIEGLTPIIINDTVKITQVVVGAAQQIAQNVTDHIVTNVLPGHVPAVTPVKVVNTGADAG